MGNGDTKETEINDYHPLKDFRKIDVDDGGIINKDDANIGNSINNQVGIVSEGFLGNILEGFDELCQAITPRHNTTAIDAPATTILSHSDYEEEEEDQHQLQIEIEIRRKNNDLDNGNKDDDASRDAITVVDAVAKQLKRKKK